MNDKGKGGTVFEQVFKDCFLCFRCESLVSEITEDKFFWHFSEIKCLPLSMPKWYVSPVRGSCNKTD